ncbi:UPF0669 protein v1g209471-like [Asterias rubens]|uniref:UPF0669 protein v1g209471-like n=1 Tax=Asterias rubens TaxID=7604 RepID=UPI001455B301|nr:UPF0669 protein v1g209471-like [Asterias rubens]
MYMFVSVRLSTIVLFLHILLSWLHGYICETHILLQTVTGSVPSGNFTYYKLSRNGNIRFSLRTLEGDADVYVSSTTMHPTYDDYDMKAATFGEEIIDICQSIERPVGIGVYGHPLYPNVTLYEFDILLDQTLEEVDPWRMESEQDPSVGKLYPMDEEPEKESLLWSLFIGILKVALDIMI